MEKHRGRAQCTGDDFLSRRRKHDNCGIVCSGIANTVRYDEREVL